MMETLHLLNDSPLHFAKGSGKSGAGASAGVGSEPFSSALQNQMQQHGHASTTDSAAGSEPSRATGPDGKTRSPAGDKAGQGDTRQRDTANAASERHGATRNASDPASDEQPATPASAADQLPSQAGNGATADTRTGLFVAPGLLNPVADIDDGGDGESAEPVTEQVVPGQVISAGSTDALGQQQIAAGLPRDTLTRDDVGSAGTGPVETGEQSQAASQSTSLATSETARTLTPTGDQTGRPTHAGGIPFRRNDNSGGGILNAQSRDNSGVAVNTTDTSPAMPDEGENAASPARPEQAAPGRFLDELVDSMQSATGRESRSVERAQLQPLPRIVNAPDIDTGTAPDGGELTGLRENFSATLNQIADTRASARAPTLSLYSQPEAGTEQWQQDIGTKITWLNSHKINKAEISLHPAELGALDISIDTDNDRITVSITTRNDAAREILENSLPRLSELLRNNGLTLEQGSVNRETGSGDDSHQGQLADGPSAGSADPEEDASGMDFMQRRTTFHNGQIDHYV